MTRRLCTDQWDAHNRLPMLSISKMWPVLRRPKPLQMNGHAPTDSVPAEPGISWGGARPHHCVEDEHWILSGTRDLVFDVGSSHGGPTAGPAERPEQSRGPEAPTTIISCAPSAGTFAGSLAPGRPGQLAPQARWLPGHSPSTLWPPARTWQEFLDTTVNPGRVVDWRLVDPTQEAPLLVARPRSNNYHSRTVSGPIRGEPTLDVGGATTRKFRAHATAWGSQIATRTCVRSVLR